MAKERPAIPAPTTRKSHVMGAAGWSRKWFRKGQKPSRQGAGCPEFTRRLDQARSRVAGVGLAIGPSNDRRRREAPRLRELNHVAARTDDREIGRREALSRLLRDGLVDQGLVEIRGPLATRQR